MKIIIALFTVMLIISCSPLLNVITTPNAKQLWQQHKRIAITPLKVSSEGLKIVKKEKLQQEEENMRKLSFSIQNNMYNVLQNQFELSNLSVTLMPTDSTTLLLAQAGINYYNLPVKNINQLCAILNVDAVLAGDVEISNMDKFWTTMSATTTPMIERATVQLRIYDKGQQNAIWTFKEEDKAREYNEYYKRSSITTVSNGEYLVAYLFDKAMKILPYVIKSPIKRTY
jgi:hypothetical protein